MFSLSRLLNGFRTPTARGRAASRRSADPRFRPAFDVLEERTVPSTVSSIAGNCNSTPIPAGVTVNWEWAAAVYKSFSTDNNTLGVKPVDSNSLSVYHNGDQSGTPEAFKAFVVKGAMGSAGTNYTGNFTATKSVKPALGDGL